MVAPGTFINSCQHVDQISCSDGKIGAWKCELGNQKISCSCQGAHGAWTACMPAPDEPSIFDVLAPGNSGILDPGPVVISDPLLGDVQDPATSGETVAPPPSAQLDAGPAAVADDQNQATPKGKVRPSSSLHHRKNPGDGTGM